MTALYVWYAIPADARATECRACREPMYFITSENGRKVPVSCEVDGSYPPDAQSEGLGVSHFGTCTEPNRFSKRGAAR
jgi:hypothetical protein